MFHSSESPPPEYRPPHEAVMPPEFRQPAEDGVAVPSVETTHDFKLPDDPTMRTELHDEVFPRSDASLPAADYVVAADTGETTLPTPWSLPYRSERQVEPADGQPETAEPGEAGPPSEPPGPPQEPPVPSAGGEEGDDGENGRELGQPAAVEMRAEPLDDAPSHGIEQFRNEQPPQTPREIDALREGQYVFTDLIFGKYLAFTEARGSGYVVETVVVDQDGGRTITFLTSERGGLLAYFRERSPRGWLESVHQYIVADGKLYRRDVNIEAYNEFVDEAHGDGSSSLQEINELINAHREAAEARASIERMFDTPVSAAEAQYIWGKLARSLPQTYHFTRLHDIYDEQATRTRPVTFDDAVLAADVLTMYVKGIIAEHRGLLLEPARFSNLGRDFKSLVVHYGLNEDLRVYVEAKYWATLNPQGAASMLLDGGVEVTEDMMRSFQEKQPRMYEALDCRVVHLPETEETPAHDELWYRFTRVIRQGNRILLDTSPGVPLVANARIGYALRNFIYWPHVLHPTSTESQQR